MAVEKDELFAMMRSAAQAQPRVSSASAASVDQPVADEADQMLAQMKAASQQFPEQREWYKEFTPTAIGRTAAGAADVLLGVVPAAAGKIAEYATQFRQPSLPLNRLTPQQMFAEQQARAREATRAKQETTTAVEQYLPGKLAGVTETPEYRGELLQQLSSRLGQAVAPKVEQAGQYYESLGLMPKEQVASAIETGAAALTPPVAGAVTRGAKTFARGVKGAVAEVRASRATPTIGTREAAIADAQDVTGQAVNQFGARSAGAAEAPKLAEVQAALTSASPELRSVIEAIPANDANVPTIMRHIEADTLPVPIKLTKGQATGDPVLLSREQNRRGRDPQLAEVFNEQNKGLVENLSAIRDTAAPDVYTARTIENSENLIQAYRDLDKARQDKITEAYKALTDAAGGNFPVNGKRIAETAEASLKKSLKSEFLSPGIRSQLEAFKAGERMTFEQFEAMRTNLAAEIRAAERAGDGNREMAASLVREAMESLPLSNKAGKLKSIADNARKLAKERFDALRADPAYKAAVNDAVAADKFFDKFVIRGVNKNVERMVETLGRGSPAHQNLAAGALNWLSDRAGLVDGKGNFSQAGFNKALKQLDDIRNMPLIFDPKTATQLRSLGNVAGYTQYQPRGSFVNNSNTLVGALAEHAKTGAAAAIDVKTGLPVGSYVKRKMAERRERKETEQSLAVGAGSRIADIAKEK